MNYQMKKNKVPHDLWQDMEEAFDSTIDDCFYEFNEAAAAMLYSIASAMEQAIAPDQHAAHVSVWLKEEAAKALSLTQKP